MSSRPDFFGTHRELLEAAVTATATREYFSPFPETPSTRVYGEAAPQAGADAFAAVRGTQYAVAGPPSVAWVGAERSAYDGPLDISYPEYAAGGLVTTARAALPGWRDAGVRARTGVALEILSRLNARSFELAHAVMHTTGQAFVMAFQAGGTHAQERGLEAVAYAYAESTRHAGTARWEKAQRRGDPLVQEKEFTVVPRGVAAGHRLPHVPDLEFLPRPVRQSGHR